MPDWRLATMGFSYSEWAGAFYPESLKPGDYLSFYSRYFDTVELDTTFHATPPVDRVRRWADVTPESFRFCVKTPRAVTHEYSLGRNMPAMLEFLDTMRAMGEKLAVVLIQFPPAFGVSESDSLEGFLSRLPTDLRYAVEFRNTSWHNNRTADVLRAQRVAWVWADYAADIARIPATSDFLYVRWVGQHNRFGIKDREQIDVAPRLEWWSEKLNAAVEKTPVQSVWGFFNNDFSGYAIRTCNRMKRLLGVPVTEPAGAEQGSLFG